MTNDTMDTLDKQKYTPGEMYMILAVLYFFPPIGNILFPSNSTRLGQTQSTF